MKVGRRQFERFGRTACPPELLAPRFRSEEVKSVPREDVLLGRYIYREIRKLLVDCEMELSQPLALRVREILSAFLLIRRLEDALLDDGVVMKPKGGEDGATAGRLSAAHPIAEARAKTWERLRRSLQELAELCGRKARKPAATVAERVQALLDSTDGLLEEVLEPEEGQRTKDEGQMAVT
ncbi:MAG: hypothetical protein HY706_10095 [Candidatus Hydrogenedentes bacterium]|nr:hypothetical protein [Candidatus Hydrogenedentota bacterium]